jgi:hypothetical protein
MKISTCLKVLTFMIKNRKNNLRKLGKPKRQMLRCLMVLLLRVSKPLLTTIKLLSMRSIIGKKKLKKFFWRSVVRFIMSLMKELTSSKSRFKLIMKRKRIVSMITSKKRRSLRIILKLWHQLLSVLMMRIVFWWRKMESSKFNISVKRMTEISFLDNSYSTKSKMWILEINIETWRRELRKLNKLKKLMKLLDY